MQALLRCILAFFRTRKKQAIIELALRQQLATYARARTRPSLTSLDRAFWVALHRLWPRWKEVLVSVKPETVMRWHRKGFRLYWRALSRRGPGRPRVPQEVRELIRRLAFENGWRARKIQGELSKLGFTISLATVSRYLPKRLPDPGRRQRWTTFLRNHKDAIAAWAWQGNPYLGAVVGAAMAINTLIAVSLGGVVPLLLRRLRVDPALASGPILTSVTDMCGFALVLGIATACLPLLTHS